MGQNTSVLNEETLPRVTLDRFSYRREKVSTGVLHFGPGRFHRAHQARYFDEALERGELQWGVQGVSFCTAAQATHAGAQQGLYTLVEHGTHRTSARIIGALRGILFAPTAYDELLRIASDPALHIVTLSVTEKGYSPASEGISPLRALVDILALRKKSSVAAPTIISCDNIPENGRVLADAVLAIANRRSDRLARWIEDRVAFPSTVVDRIVPQAGADESRSVTSLLNGLQDSLSVVSETYRSWIVEDRFSSARPRLEESGVIFTSDIRRYHEAKIRLLNATHSALVPAGLLLGYREVKKALDDPLLLQFVRTLASQCIIPTLDPIPSFSMPAYFEEILSRFKNASLVHSLSKIAEDTSVKIPLRFGETLSRAVARRMSLRYIAFVLASWMETLGERDEEGGHFPLRDTNLREYRGLISSAGSGREAINAVCARLPKEFQHAPLIGEIESLLFMIRKQGVRATLQSLL